jgi:hypothetical protein
MKNIFLFIISLLMIVSCSKKDVKFEAFGVEAFAFDIGDGTSEVNATVRVKGFTQTENNDKYKASVAYEVDLLKPDNTIRNSVFKYVQNAEKGEPINDVALDVQFVLDSTYSVGTYTLIYKIADKFSDNKLETKVNFDLTRD